MYRKIIFDLDGVITSEEAFWDSAALTTAEFMGIDSEDPVALRKTLFYNDRIIKLVKNRGVNSNWDLVYLTLAFWETDAKGVFDAISALPLRDFELYRFAGELLVKKTGRPFEEVKRSGPYWQQMADSFQEWFLGSEMFAAVNHKPAIGGREGLWINEEPIVGRENLKKTLSALSEKGISLRIGTARPLPEGREPLIRWGVYDYFDKDGAITYDYIKAAQEKSGQAALGKPHPYIFLKSYFGKDFPDAAILEGDYPKDFSDCLVVGDAGADLFAAQAMGADFAAVLTGIAGEEAKPFFIENGAKYIFKDVTEILNIWN